MLAGGGSPAQCPRDNTTLPSMCFLRLLQASLRTFPFPLSNAFCLPVGMQLPRGLWTTCDNIHPVLGRAKLFVTR